MREEEKKKLADIGEQVSLGKMTINQAREILGLKRHEDNGKSDQYIMSENFIAILRKIRRKGKT